MYEQQKKRAEQQMQNILGGVIDGKRVNIQRGHTVKWASPLNPGWYGIPEGNRKFVVEPATINIGDWLQVQSGDNLLSPFLSEAYGPTVEQAAESIRSGRNDIPTPVLEVNSAGELLAQEGRSRAVGARRGGATRMPIWVAVRVYR